MPVYRTAPPPDVSILAAYPGKVVAYDPATGQERWSYAPSKPGPPFPGGRPTAIAATEDRVYLLTGRFVPAEGLLDDARMFVELAALDAATGACLWTQVVDRGLAPSRTAMSLVVKGEVVTVAHADVLVALDPETGAIRWCREVDPLLGLAVAG